MSNVDMRIPIMVENNSTAVIRIYPIVVNWQISYLRMKVV